MEESKVHFRTVGELAKWYDGYLKEKGQEAKEEEKNCMSKIGKEEGREDGLQGRQQGNRPPY
jgi:hypothetical protein